MPKNDPNLWMWKRAWSLLDRADRMNRGFAQSETSQVEPSVWQPPVDVYRSEAALWILVALPGVSADTVSLSIVGNELVIAGVRKRPDEIVPAEVLRIEIPHGRFERRIALPPGTHELRTRRMVDGCLVLEVILG